MATAQQQSENAIAALNKLPQQLADYIAKLNGTQNAEQKVSENTTQQNIQIVQNLGSLSTGQAVKKFTNQIIKALGAT